MAVRENRAVLRQIERFGVLSHVQSSVLDVSTVVHGVWTSQRSERPKYRGRDWRASGPSFVSKPRKRDEAAMEVRVWFSNFGWRSACHVCEVAAEKRAKSTRGITFSAAVKDPLDRLSPLWVAAAWSSSSGPCDRRCWQD